MHLKQNLEHYLRSEQLLVLRPGWTSSHRLWRCSIIKAVGEQLIPRAVYHSHCALGVLTCQSQQTLVCKPPTSRQRPPRQSSPRQSSPPHSAGSQDPPAPQWCKTEEHHPVCCSKKAKAKQNGEIKGALLLHRDIEKGLQYCLPEVCVGDVLVDKLVQRTVDDFVEVHRVLLQQGREQIQVRWSKCMGDTEATVHNGNLNNQTVVTHLPYIVRGTSMLHRHVTKAFLTKG